MKKNIFFVLICQTLLFHINLAIAGELKVTTGNLNENPNYKKAYFAGGCFWCMEESFDKVEGVIETISGYSGGHVKNPKYKDVIKNTTGHYETLEITYDPSITNFEKLLELTKAETVQDVFPNLSLFAHGGAAYTPYAEKFKQL